MRDFLQKLMGNGGGGGGGKDGDDGDGMTGDESLRLAAVALLFRAVAVDGREDEAELAQVRRIASDAFGLDGEATESLLADARAAARDATDLHGWTRLVNAEYDEAEKIRLLELLWQVVLADGVVDVHEHALMRRLAGLIYVRDVDSAHARARAAGALETDGE